jgi:hypothetical protein
MTIVLLGASGKVPRNSAVLTSLISGANVAMAVAGIERSKSE